MVGFGSSLRIARRPGWEGAYLDYETLKLLLSQIEAVYEEEGHQQRRRQVTVFGDPRITEEDGHGKSKNLVRDYREELFMCENSDEAFASLEEFDSSNEDGCGSDGTNPRTRLGDDKNHPSYPGHSYHHPAHHIQYHHHHHHHNPSSVVSNQPFLPSYSKEASSSDEDEDKGSGCGAGVTYSFSSWTAWDKSSSSLAEPKKRRQSNNVKHLPEEDAFYLKGAVHNTNFDAFYMATASMSYDGGEQRALAGHSFLNAPVRESSSLLPTGAPSATGVSTTTSGSSSAVQVSVASGGGGVGESFSPPIPLYGAMATSGRQITEGAGSTGAGSGSSAAGNPEHAISGGAGMGTAGAGLESSYSASPVLPPYVIPQQQQQKIQKKFLLERKRERLQRRMRQKRLRAIRRLKEKKIPRHLRLAHAKARAITERFLGLLRAETEKVMLFAQARLGELADTAGSLRFSNIDDFDSNSLNNQKTDYRGTSGVPATPFDYPFSDGGLHPSASSSEDEGVAAGQGTWSDSSEEEEAKGGEAARVAFSLPGQTERNLPTGERRKRSKSGKSAAIKKKTERRADSSGRAQEYTNAAARRQIAHFTDLRKRRPIFLRNDQILGEDMLLISAVEEVDGYTAVGVELIHVLRFICVNLMAVRKICAKHDRLLMNRMLGGYYHRTRNPHGHELSRIEGQTLGGLIARNSGDIYEAHPAVIGNMSQYKLVGLYDRKIQKMINSRTVQVVSSCLALALSEYEVARSRADALTKLNSGGAETPRRSGGHDISFPKNKNDEFYSGGFSDDENCEGPPSTTSSISLTRLRFTVTSIFALREAARYKTQHFYTYLSRSMLTFTGRPIIGEGLDGCSRATLDLFVAFNPDAAILLDTGVLFDGLNRGRWMKESLADLMISTLGVAISPSASSPSPSLLLQDLTNVVNSLNIDPSTRALDIKRFTQRGDAVERFNYLHPELPLVAKNLNALGCLLYTMNYYVAHASTNTFLSSCGQPYAHSSILIGAPNLSAVIIAIAHAFLLSGDNTSHSSRATVKVGLVRKLLLCSGFFGTVGNIINAVAIDKQNVSMALLGRFVIGFSSGEIVYRQLVQAFWPSLVVSASAQIVLARMAGTILGLVLGICAEIVPLKFPLAGIRSMQFASWFMAVLWLTYIILLLVQFRNKVRVQHIGRSSDKAEASGGVPDDIDGDYEYESSDSDHIGTPRSFWSSSKLSEEIGGMSLGGGSDNQHVANESVPLTLKQSATKGPRKRGTRATRTFPARLKKLLSYHVAFTTLLVIVAYVNYGIELFLTATPLITHHYFDWGGPRAGALLVLLAVLVLPISFFCERIARKYEERTILKRTIVVASFGSFLLINWTSCFSLAQKVPKLLQEMADIQHTNTYDWNFGVFQYTIGVVVVFIGLVSVESATLSLLSKLSPLRLRSVVLNLGTVVVVLSFLARILGDVQLLSVVLSHRLINTDIINTVAVPIFAFSFVIMWLIRRHFFYLM